MIDLDDLSALRTLDPGGMLGDVQGFPEQCSRGWTAGGKLHLPAGYRDVERVVGGGMGGSAIAGDVVADLAAFEEGAPVQIHRDYDLPPGVDAQTLVIVSSYSGSTEEALSSFAAAQARGLKTLAITGGGALAERARAHGVPVHAVPLQAPPRATLGYTLLFLLRILSGLGLVSDKTAEIREMEGVLSETGKLLGPETATERNPAKALARHLHGRVPVVWAGGILASAARRWKTQLNENAKIWAFAETFPEVDHNSIVASVAAPEMRGQVCVLLLRSSALPYRLQERYEQTEKLLQAHHVATARVDAWGTSPLVQALTAILYGDWVSVYLAALYGVDPTPTGPIDLLKRRMAGRGELGL